MSDRTEPFDIRDGRAMVSLGRLSPKKYCTYGCLFCYVHVDFDSYASMEIPEILDWLTRQAPESYDIVYVSGDTDSFAPPRLEKGIQLLEALATLKKDLMFTTRAIFDADGLSRIEALAQRLAEDGRYLFGCVSVMQLHQPRLEPRPVPSPQARLQQLKEFRERGLVAVLAMRPFLPVVPDEEHEQILQASEGSAHVVLGETWFADQAGLLEEKVLGKERLAQYVEEPMTFDSNDAVWRVYEGKQTQALCEAWSQQTGIPFFMRSRPAIEWARMNISL